jgi:hypothetical protein
MAYMNQEKKAELAPRIKAVLKKYGMKGTISVNNYSTLVVRLNEGAIDFDTTNANVNVYWIDSNYSGVARDFLTELYRAMNGAGSSIANHDNSDIQTDYFDVGWYNDIHIGRWNRDYVVRK